MPRGGDEIYELEDLLLDESHTSDTIEMIIKEDGSKEWRKEDGGLLHNKEGPARILPNGTREWYLEGKLESVGGGPSRIEGNGIQEWHIAHRLQSIDGRPSRIYPDGTREWHEDNALSREGEPAVIWADGTREWYQDGSLSRPNALPTRERANGTKEWIRSKKPIFTEALGLYNGILVPRNRFNDTEELHREDGPARILPDGTKEWFLRGKRGRKDGGPMRILPDGTQEWYIEESLGREGGPARIRANGTKEWFTAGILNSIDDQPSIIRPNGMLEWHKDNKHHREGGPAIIEADGTQRFYLHGRPGRTDNGPTVIYPDGSEEYHKDGVLHCDWGPAKINSNERARENDGIKKAYYHMGMRTRKDGKACTLGIDSDLRFNEGAVLPRRGLIYYRIYPNGVEEIWEEDKTLLATSNGESHHFPDMPTQQDLEKQYREAHNKEGSRPTQKKLDSVERELEQIKRVFAEMRSRTRDLRF